MEGMIEQDLRKEYTPILIKIKELDCIPNDIEKEIDTLLERTRKINSRYGIKSDF